MITWEQIEAQVKRERYEGEGFNCPHCGSRHDISDSEVCQAVISYWGEEPHEFSCSHCDKDFLVRENVTRRFEAAATHDDFE